MPPSNTNPEATYQAFYTEASIRSVATTFGVTRLTLHRWWVGKFGQEAYDQRVSKLASIPKPRMSLEEKKRRKKAYKNKNKESVREADKRWRVSNLARVSEVSAKYREEHREEMRVYGKNYYTLNKESILSSRDRELLRFKEKDRYTKHPEKLLRTLAKQRAKRYGVPFSITSEYIKSCIPADGCCPITGQPFERGVGKVGPRSMTLDRIFPELGYVPGNIAVISHLANSIKQNCTDPEVFRRVARYLEYHQGPTLKKVG